MPKFKEKLSTDELLRLACQYAQNDQESLLEALGDSSPEATAETQDFLDQLREYRRKRWGPKPQKKRNEPRPTTEIPVKIDDIRVGDRFVCKVSHFNDRLPFTLPPGTKYYEKVIGIAKNTRWYKTFEVQFESADCAPLSDAVHLAEYARKFTVYVVRNIQPNEE